MVSDCYHCTTTLAGRSNDHMSLDICEDSYKCLEPYGFDLDIRFIIQGDPSRFAKPPVDFKTKVPLWTDQARPSRAWSGQSGTYVLKSTGGFAQAALSPCKDVILKRIFHAFFPSCGTSSPPPSLGALHLAVQWRLQLAILRQLRRRPTALYCDSSCAWQTVASSVAIASSG